MNLSFSDFKEISKETFQDLLTDVLTYAVLDEGEWDDDVVAVSHYFTEVDHTYIATMQVRDDGVAYYTLDEEIVDDAISEAELYELLHG